MEGFNKKDIFVEGGPNKKDYLYVVGFFLLLMLPFIFNFIQSSSIKSYGSIYLPIFILTFTGIGFALITRNGLTREVIYGNIKDDKALYYSVLVGAGFGFLLISSLIFGGSSFLSFFRLDVPFSIGVVPTVASQSIALLVVVAIFAVETEESLRASFLVPTFANLRMPILFIFAGIVTLAISQLYIITILFFFFALFFAFSKRLSQKVSTSNFDRHLSSILVAAVVFGLFHIYAYGSSVNELQLIESAIAFAVVADLINWYLQNAIASRIAHSINNSFVLAAVTGINFGLAGLVVLLYIIIIVMLYKMKGFFAAKGKASVDVSYA